MLYPLTFRPILQERVWGGRSLERLFGKALPPAPTPIGESWEISDRPEAVSIISNGPLEGKDLRFLMETQRNALLGSAADAAGRFPLLIKLLDAQQALSLQVHPPASMAAALQGDPKTEIWYVAEAAPQAELYAGLKRGVTQAEFAARLAAGTVADCFHRLQPQIGQALFIPSGRVHALGAGYVVFEIQQNSDTTYRVFDWNRVGLDGKPRQLHTKEALQCIDFSDFEPQLIQSQFERRRGLHERTLVSEPVFQVEEWQGDAGVLVPFFAIGRPTILGVVSGGLRIHDRKSAETVHLQAGQFCLIPACVDDVELESQANLVCLMARPGEAGLPRRERLDRGAEATARAWETYGGMRPVPRPHSTRLIPSWGQVKKDLSRRFTYSRFIQLAVSSFWFRVTFGAFVCFVVSLALFLPKIWRMTPAGFLPIVKVSGLDRAQAFMLRRSAERASAEGHYGEAAYAWQAALANNPADPDLVRGEIRTSLLNPKPNPQNDQTAFHNSFWLLRLTNTNRDDLELSVKLYEKLNLYSIVAEILRPLTNSLSGSLEASYMKTLFFEQDWRAFEARWQSRAAAGQTDPELSLFWWAYVAGWKTTADSGVAFTKLQAAASRQEPSALVANRLILAVSLNRQDAASAEAALKRLASAGSDSVFDHTLYWRVLVANGNKESAKRLAEVFTGTPTTARETAMLVQSLLDVDLEDRAIKVMQERLNQLGPTHELWVTLANLLMDRQRWDELRALAVRIREQDIVRHELEAYSYYLEGRAALQQGRTGPALASFDQAAGFPSPNPAVALLMAKGLLKLEYAAQAKRLLTGREKELGDRPDYWQTVFEVGLRLKDPDFLVVGARKQYEAHPDDPVQVNRYAAALLATRFQGEEAVKLTLELVRARPDSLAAMVNHSMALLLNRRTEEAGALLDRVKPESLLGGESTAYHLARFELCFQRKQYDKASQEVSKIDPEFLFPQQKAWLSDCQLALRSH